MSYRPLWTMKDPGCCSGKLSRVGKQFAFTPLAVPSRILPEDQKNLALPRRGQGRRLGQFRKTMRSLDRLEALQRGSLLRARSGDQDSTSLSEFELRFARRDVEGAVQAVSLERFLEGLDDTQIYAALAMRRGWKLERSGAPGRIRARSQGDIFQTVRKADETDDALASGKDKWMFELGLVGAGAFGLPDIGASAGPREVVNEILLHNVREAINARTAALVTQLGRDSREAIREFVREALLQGQQPAEVAKRIESVIGLTSRQAATLGRIQGLLTQQGEDPETITREIKKRADRVFKNRAATIARTEMVDALQDGKQSYLEQLVEDDVIDPRETRRFWLTANDERVSDICRDIALSNASGVGVSEPFKSNLLSGGQIMRPPAHPNCRSDVVTDFVEAREAA